MNISPISFAVFKGQKDTGSKWGHEGKNWGQNGDKWGQNGSKWGQNGDKWGHNGSGWDRERYEQQQYEDAMAHIKRGPSTKNN